MATSGAPSGVQMRGQPQRPRQLDEARIGEEFRQITAQRARRRRVRAAEVRQQDARSFRRRRRDGVRRRDHVS
jgi:hypothetical protein